MAKRAFAGWREYREGRKRKSENHPPIYRGDKRKHMVSMTMDLLRDWRLSHFEFEGPARAGLRSALCLDGYEWEWADREATNLVAEALRLLGAVRPTWDQGQRDHVEPRENCRTCGGAIPEEMMMGRYRIGFCSGDCARMFLVKRDFAKRDTSDAVYSAAWRIVQRSQWPPRQCEACGKKFRPTKQRGKYCSPDCGKNAPAHVPVTIRRCILCGTRFGAKAANARFCSGSCSRQFNRYEQGLMPRRLTPIVFDYIMKLAA